MLENNTEILELLYCLTVDWDDPKALLSNLFYLAATVICMLHQVCLFIYLLFVLCCLVCIKFDLIAYYIV